MDDIQLAPGDGLRLLAEGVDQVDGIALLEIVDDPDLACPVAEPEFMQTGTDAWLNCTIKSSGNRRSRGWRPTWLF